MLKGLRLAVFLIATITFITVGVGCGTDATTTATTGAIPTLSADCGSSKCM